MIKSSQDLIQGMTLAGVFFDEVALMPYSFVDQAMARCSVEGAKYWFNCNPKNPNHWFKVEFIDKAKEVVIDARLEEVVYGMYLDSRVDYEMVEDVSTATYYFYRKIK